MIRRLLPFVLLAAFAGHAHAQRAAPAAPERDRISPEEVRGSAASDAYQLVQSLRSMWLTRREARLATPFAPTPPRDAEGLVDGVHGRAASTGSQEEADGRDGLIVLLDAALLGGRESLHEVPVNRIRSVEFLSPEQARLRYDRRTRDGAIVIHTLDARDR